MQPRSDGTQRCHSFELQTSPRSQVNAYRDFLGNTVHHFDIPRSHGQLTITGKALVGLKPHPELPEKLDHGAWERLERNIRDEDHWEMLLPSRFVLCTESLQSYIRETGLSRRDDPLTTLRDICATIDANFTYAKQCTKVDSSIDEALATRKGVCQDFAHIMIALARQLRIPCRYVSGYLYHGQDDDERATPGATHAWVEALLPELGWVGFDPTHNLDVRERHIRVAVGRDYADVPPTRGVFKGRAEGELSVAVQVALADDAPVEQDFLPVGAVSASDAKSDTSFEQLEQQQQ